MFERQVALERAQGYRGLATRLFAPISTLEEAELLIKEASLTLAGVAGLFALAAIKFSALMLILAVGIGLPALLLLATRARAASVFLAISVLLSSGLYIVGGARGIWVIVMPLLLCGLAVRASEATFKRHAFRNTASLPPIAFQPPGSSAV